MKLISRLLRTRKGIPFSPITSIDTIYLNNGQKIDTKLQQISNPNLLDNSYFGKPVNQRGKTQYTSTANASTYAIDRWAVYGGSTLTIGSSGACALENGLMYQLIEGCNLNATYTFTVESWSGTVSVTGIPSVGANASNGSITVTITKTGSYMQLIISATSAWLVRAKLEVGPESTSYQYKGYGAELNECMRYFQAIDATHCTALAYNTTSAAIRGPLFLPMRAVPTLTLEGAIGEYSFTDSASSYTCSTLIATYPSKDTARANIGSSGLTTYKVYWFNSATSKRVFLSADL